MLSFILGFVGSQISAGLHLLERAKTCWNHIVCSRSTENRELLATELEEAITSARDVIMVIGNEGDANDGPIDELQTLMDIRTSI